MSVYGSTNEENNPYSITEEELQKRLAKGNRGRYSTQLYAAITGGFIF